MIEQPLILLSGQESKPYSILLYDMQIAQPQTVFAASLVSLFPILVLIILFLMMRKWANRKNPNQFSCKQPS